MFRMRLKEMVRMSPHSSYRGKLCAKFIKQQNDFNEDDLKTLIPGSNMVVLTEKEYEELVGKLVTKE